jgi:hypothetical protein
VLNQGSYLKEIKHMEQSGFDIFVALDGPGLDGRVGMAGVLKVFVSEYSLGNNSYYLGFSEPKIRFYKGAAGGHAIQISPSGKFGFLGGFARCPVIFNTETLEPVKQLDLMDHEEHLSIPYASQTHAVWLDDDSLITTIGRFFWKINLRDGSKEVLGSHQVEIPHAVKKSPSGKYLFYGAMDDDFRGPAKKVGIFNLEAKETKIVNLDDTAWHFGVHPTEDIFYPVTECYEPGPGKGRMPYDYTGLSIGWRNNYAWKIDGATGEVLSKFSIPASLPSHLTSDVLVLGDEKDTVIYNTCASSTITVIEFATRKIRHIDEGVGFFEPLKHPGLIRTAIGTLVEVFGLANIPGNTHLLTRALRISRGSLLDGSYGLAFSPSKSHIISAHRGLNQLIVYSYPSFEVVKRIDLPPVRKFFKEYMGVMSDPRLGLHHATVIYR